MLRGLTVHWLAALLGAAPIPAAVAAAAEPPDVVEWQAHIAGLERLVARDPDNPNHYLRVAQAYSELGDTPRVVALAQQAEQHGAHPTQAHLLLADHYLKMHRFEQALKSYGRALRSAPNSALGWTRSWRALYELRRTDTPTRLDLQVIARDLERRGYYFPRAWRQPGPTPTEAPKDARRHTGVGYGRLEQGDLAGAVRAFHLALDAQPAFADAFRGLGIAHARQRRLTMALGAYSLFLELAEPDHADVGRIRQIIVDYYRSQTR